MKYSTILLCRFNKKSLPKPITSIIIHKTDMACVQMMHFFYKLKSTVDKKKKMFLTVFDSSSATCADRGNTFLIMLNYWSIEKYFLLNLWFRLKTIWFSFEIAPSWPYPSQSHISSLRTLFGYRRHVTVAV